MPPCSILTQYRFYCSKLIGFPGLCSITARNARLMDYGLSYSVIQQTLFRYKLERDKKFNLPT